MKGHEDERQYLVDPKAERAAQAPRRLTPGGENLWPGVRNDLFLAHLSIYRFAAGASTSSPTAGSAAFPRVKSEKYRARCQKSRRITSYYFRKSHGTAASGKDVMFVNHDRVATYIDLGGSAQDEYESLLAEHGNSEVRAMMMTWAEQIEARAEATGYERGIEDGSLQGMRDLVLGLLKRRFARVPAAVARQIADLDSRSKLMQLAEEVPSIDSPGDLSFD